MWKTHYWFDAQFHRLNLHRFAYDVAVKKYTLVARGPPGVRGPWARAHRAHWIRGPCTPLLFDAPLQGTPGNIGINLTLSESRAELDMDWIHPWIGLDWIGLDWVQFLVNNWIGSDWVRSIL